MEETKYHRKLVLDNEMRKHEGRGLKGDKNAELNMSATADQETTSDHAPRKSFYQKLKVFDKQELRYPNRLKGMIVRPLTFLRFPIISYAGFSYGSNLIWFNVLNGTTSLILSGKPYGFSSSIVGLSYISPLMGVILG